MVDKILEKIEGMTQEEKMHGYAHVMHEYIVYLRAGMIEENDIAKYADVIHELPVFLIRQLDGFKDDYFWNKATRFHGLILTTLYLWFEMGVSAFLMDKEILDLKR